MLDGYEMCHEKVRELLIQFCLARPYIDGDLERYLSRYLSNMRCIRYLSNMRCTRVWRTTVEILAAKLASSLGHSQILSRSCGEKSGEGLVPLLPHEPEMVDSVST